MSINSPSSPVTIPFMTAASRILALVLMAFTVAITACEKRSDAHAHEEIKPIKIGVLHSRTGPMAISEKSVIDATILAIEDVNENGGVLGRPLKPIIIDGSSNEELFAQGAARLLDDEKVSVIFGCWTSASRKAVRPVIESRNGLLFYPVQYEGLEQSPNIVYLGATPNQQIIPAIDWAMSNLNATRFLLVGSDYVFPRSANTIIRDHVEQAGGEIVGEEYIGLGSRETTRLIDAASKTQPDVILSTINGDANVTFFRGLREAGIDSEEMPTVSFSISESELRGLSSQHVVGDYAAWNYFQSIPGEDNLRFVRKFGERYHPRRVLSDPMQSAWNAVHLWANAANKAGSIQPQMVKQALSSSQFDAPEGRIQIDPDNQHAWMRTRIGQITPARFFDIVWESDSLVPPRPFPEYRTRAEWEDYLKGMHQDWGGQWSNPETE
tara:strand:+ start:7991 stop:9307 length:1317 start_codon:yes stop_codon:yes gene_type:complete